MADLLEFSDGDNEDDNNVWEEQSSLLKVKFEAIKDEPSTSLGSIKHETDNTNDNDDDSDDLPPLERDPLFAPKSRKTVPEQYAPHSLADQRSVAQAEYALVTHLTSMPALTHAQNVTDKQEKKHSMYFQNRLRKYQTLQKQLDLFQSPSGLPLVFRTVLASVNLDCAVDLRFAALTITNAEFKPTKMSAAVFIRIRQPPTTATLFANGRMNVTGAKSEFEAFIATRRLSRKVQKAGYDVKFKSFRIESVSADSDCGFGVRLQDLSDDDPTASYEPEVFAGIFSSGKLVFLGAKSSQSILTAYNIIFPLILKHAHRRNGQLAMGDESDDYSDFD